MKVRKRLIKSLFMFALIVPTASVYAQNEACCARAFRACGVCQPNPDPAKRTDNLTYDFCGVTGYYGQLPNSSGASAKLKACQKCIDETCPVGGKGEPEVDKKKVVQIRPPDKEYSFCKQAFSTVYVVKMPAGFDTLAAMGEVEPDGSLGGIYSIDERAKLPGRTVIVVPGINDGNYDAWRVNVLFGASAEGYMNADTVLRLPCFARETLRERISAQIEVAGGFVKFLIDSLQNHDSVPDFPEVYHVQTKEALGGIRDKPTNRGYLMPTNDLHIINAAYTPMPFATIEFQVDARTPDVTKFSIRGAELDVTPTNPALRPFILRSGEKVSITRSTIGPVTPIDGGSSGIASPQGCGIGRRWNLTNEYGARAVWTRIGNSSVFDAHYTYADGSAFDERPVVTLTGKNITARVDYTLIASSCTFVGTLAPDGRTASGTFTCTASPGKAARWNAEIFCQ